MEEWVELLRVLMQGQAGNQEAFIKCHGMPVLGNILAKVLVARGGGGGYGGGGGGGGDGVVVMGWWCW